MCAFFRVQNQPYSNFHINVIWWQNKLAYQWPVQTSFSNDVLIFKFKDGEKKFNLCKIKHSKIFNMFLNRLCFFLSYRQSWWKYRWLKWISVLRNIFGEIAESCSIRNGLIIFLKFNSLILVSIKSKLCLQITEEWLPLPAYKNTLLWRTGKALLNAETHYTSKHAQWVLYYWT